MKRAAVVACLASLLIAGAASAQPQPLDTAKLDLARKIIAETGGVEAVKAQLNSLYGPLFAGLTADMPADQRELTMRLQQDIVAEVMTIIPAMIDASAEAYARNLTEGELRDVLAWQTSTSGRALASKMPAIRAELIQKEIPLIKAMMPAMVKRAAERACDELKCSPAQRQSVASAVQKALKPGS